MNKALVALGRGFTSLLHPQMLSLLVWPFLAALLGWGLLAWFAWDSLHAWVQASLIDGLAPVRWVFAKLAAIGLEGAGGVATTLISIMVAVPMIFATGMALVAVLAVPVVTRHLGQRYPDVVRRGSWSIGASLWNAISSLALFMLGYLLTLPLWLIPPLALVVPWLWWSWLTARMMRFDSLVEHAERSERHALIVGHRRSFFLLGLLVTALNYVPPLFLVTPVLGALAYVHFSLDLLRRERALPR